MSVYITFFQIADKNRTESRDEAELQTSKQNESSDVAFCRFFQVIFACNKNQITGIFSRTEVERSLADEEPRTWNWGKFHGLEKEVEDDHPGNPFKTPVIDAFNLRFPTYKSCPTLSCKTSAFQHSRQGLQRMSRQMAGGLKIRPRGQTWC